MSDGDGKYSYRDDAAKAWAALQAHGAHLRREGYKQPQGP